MLLALPMSILQGFAHPLRHLCNHNTHSNHLVDVVSSITMIVTVIVIAFRYVILVVILTKICYLCGITCGDPPSSVELFQTCKCLCCTCSLSAAILAGVGAFTGFDDCQGFWELGLFVSGSKYWKVNILSIDPPGEAPCPTLYRLACVC